jgi:hypothetical protein
MLTRSRANRTLIAQVSRSGERDRLGAERSEGILWSGGLLNRPLLIGGRARVMRLDGAPARPLPFVGWVSTRSAG